mgnify:FL=1
MVARRERKPHALPLPHSIDPASLAALPRAAGVYIFQGEGTLPLYIGKSVDIRSRVLSHLRESADAAMVAQSRRIDYIETAGEIGALLLEAQLIKLRSPLYNVRLRRSRTLCTIRLAEAKQGLAPEIADGSDGAIGQTEGLYGLFSSIRAAQEKLHELAVRDQLCLGLLGLEKLSGKRGCFGVQVKTCRGACVGRESRQAHDQRLVAALVELKVHVWPFPGAIDLIEQSGDWVQKHRVRNWCYLGTWCSRAGAYGEDAPRSFDLDSYKILVKPIITGAARIEAA